MESINASAVGSRVSSWPCRFPFNDAGGERHNHHLSQTTLKKLGLKPEKSPRDSNNQPLNL